MKIKTNDIPAAVLIFNKDYEIIHVNEEAVKIFGNPKRGMKCFEFTHKNDRPCFECGEICPAKEFIKRNTDEFSTIHVHKTLAENVYDIVTIKKIMGNLYLELLKDITDIFSTQLENEKTQLETIWEIDFLTSIYNRRKIINVINSEIKKAKRYKKPFTVVMMDLDGFKMVNDNYGHIKGDEVLKTTGIILKENIRSVDYAGRYGGDEFLLIFPETESEGVIKMLARIKKDIKEMDALTHLNITASFGITSFNENDLNENDIIKRADEALYISKHGGKNRYNII